MESLKFEGLILLLVLLPGFLCARLIQALCVRPQQTELDKIIESLLYSFVVYVAFVALFGGSIPVGVQISSENGIQHYGVELHAKPLLQLAVISLLLALMVGFVVTNDVSGWVFRKLRVTQKTTRSSVWSDVFHDLRGVVHVELGDGRRLMGWLHYYSDEPKDGSLFLEKAAWVRTDTNELVPIQGPGILITQEVGIRFVEFLESGGRDAESEAKAVAGGAAEKV